MSISEKRLARIRDEFPCRECPILRCPVTARKIGMEVGARLKCETCNSTGVDWPSAFGAQGRELEKLQGELCGQRLLSRDLREKIAEKNAQLYELHRRSVSSADPEDPE